MKGFKTGNIAYSPMNLSSIIYRASKLNTLTSIVLVNNKFYFLKPNTAALEKLVKKDEEVLVGTYNKDTPSEFILEDLKFALERNNVSTC